MPNIGDVVNFHKMWPGVFIPDPIFYLKGIPMITKVIYARLLRYAGEDGRCFPKMQTLAEEMDMARRTVRDHISTLVKVGLLVREQPAKHLPNNYAFVWHQCHEDHMASLKQQGVNVPQCPPKASKGRRKSARGVGENPPTRVGENPPTGSAEILPPQESNIRESERRESEKNKNPPTKSSGILEVPELWKQPEEEPKLEDTLAAKVRALQSVPVSKGEKLPAIPKRKTFSRLEYNTYYKAYVIKGSIQKNFTALKSSINEAIKDLGGITKGGAEKLLELITEYCRAAQIYIGTKHEKFLPQLSTWLNQKYYSRKKDWFTNFKSGGHIDCKNDDPRFDEVKVTWDKQKKPA